MALTLAERAAVRDALGYPDVGSEPVDRIEGAMTALSAEGEARVRTILEQIEAADESLLSAEVLRGLTRVEDIEFANDGGRAVEHQRGRLVQRLANILGVQPKGASNTGSGPLLRG